MTPARSNAAQQATTYLRMGMKQAAEELLASAARKEPRNAEIAHLHGLVLMQGEKPAQGVSELQRAVKIDPRSPVLRIALGNALAVHKQFQQAVAAYRKAIELQPKAVAAFLGLALTLPRVNDVTGAVEAGREGLRLAPTQPEAHVNLATALKECGQSEEAITVLHRAHEASPQDAATLSLLLAAMNYAPASRGPAIARMARKYGDMVGPEECRSWPNTPDPERRLHLGYLSGDFRKHSVASFIEPILRHHDGDRFAITCYGDVKAPDATTRELQLLVPRWRDVATMKGADLVEQIRSDGVDILVELGGHTSVNRLAALAHRAAPVQATYLGYPATTGVQAMDHRIVDAVTDPPGADEYTTERLIRLSPCFLCYQPPRDAPDVATPPFEANEFLTFGSFNSMPKITAPALECWAEILARVSQSRLLLKNRSLGDPRLQQSIRGHFARRGVAGERLRFSGSAPTSFEHLARYGEIDVALDTFPYNGTTTTCEALWMGVPVVTFAGEVHAARVSASILGCVGLDDLCATDSFGYVEIAAKLAQDHDRLQHMRASMRQRMLAAPLCDAASFTRGLEQAYRSMWQTHVATRAAPA